MAEGSITQFILLLMFLTSGYGQNITLPPITFCDISSDHKLSVSHCLSKCMDIYNYNNPLQTTIFTGVKPVKMVLAKCKKFERKTVFTETWTFSKFISSITLTEVTPDPDGCDAAWDHACGRLSCSMSSPPIVPEYHWASDTVKTESYYQVDASLEYVYGTFNGSINIVTPVGIGKFSKGYMYGSRGEYVVYIWDKSSPVYDSCFISGGHYITCYMGIDSTVLCPTEGLTLSLRKPINITGCYLTGYFDKGMVFSFANISTAKEIYPPVIMTEDNKINQLSLSIRSAFQTRDALQCTSTCLTLPDYSENEIIRVNAQLYLKVKGGVYRYCYQDPSCYVSIPLIQCSGENMVKVVCGHVEYWWKTNETINQRSQICDASQISSLSLTIDTGGERVLINGSGLYWEENMTNDTPLFGPIKGTSILELGSLTQGAIIQSKNIKNSTVDQENTMIRTEVMILQWFESVCIMIQQLSHSIKVWIVSIVSTIIFILVILKWKLVRKQIKTEKKEITPRYRLVPIEGGEIKDVVVSS